MKGAFGRILASSADVWRLSYKQGIWPSTAKKASWWSSSACFECSRSLRQPNCSATVACANAPRKGRASALGLARADSGRLSIRSEV